MTAFWWMLIGAELLIFAAFYLPEPLFERFRQTTFGHILDRAWTAIRWDLWRRK